MLSSSQPISPSLSPTMQTLIPTSSTLTPPPPLLRNKNLISFKRHSISNYKKRKSTATTTTLCMLPSDFTGGVNLRNIERAIKLQSAISNKSVKQFAELIADEWRYYCADFNLQAWQLSKKAFEMLHAFLVQHSVMLVIKPTEDYGVDIGLRYIASHTRNKMPLGASGFNITTSHFYEGMIFLNNIKNVFNVLAQMKIAQKLEEELFPMIADKLVPKGVLNEKERIALMYSLLSVAIMVVFVAILKKM